MHLSATVLSSGAAAESIYRLGWTWDGRLVAISIGLFSSECLSLDLVITWTLYCTVASEIDLCLSL